jgi:hypothetical protein
MHLEGAAKVEVFGKKTDYQYYWYKIDLDRGHGTITYCDRLP